MRQDFSCFLGFTECEKKYVHGRFDGIIFLRQILVFEKIVKKVFLFKSQPFCLKSVNLKVQKRNLNFKERASIPFF